MKLQFCLLDADYIEKNNKACIRLWGTNGKKQVCVLTEYEPYFYVLPKNIDEAKKEIQKLKQKIKDADITKISEEEKIIDGKKQRVLKIFSNLPQNIPKLRDYVKRLKNVKEQYEYTINFYRRYLIDKQFSGAGWLEAEAKKNDEIFLSKQVESVNAEKKLPDMKIMSFDIETADNKIIMISVAGRNFNKIITYRKTSFKHAEIMKDEKEMIEYFIKIIQEQNPDILLTYNGDAFDFQIMQERAKSLKINLNIGRDNTPVKFERRVRTSSARIAGIVHIDLFRFISNILAPQLQTETLNLSAVASEILGDKKIDIAIEEINETWHKENDLSKLAEYCLKDSQLTLKLGEFILPHIFELSKLVGQTIFDVSRMTFSQIVEWYLSRKAFPDYIIPNQPKWDEVQKRRTRKKYTGGYVKEPIAGMHENIAVFDFRSLYPSIIASFNISPETLDSGNKEDGFKVPGSAHWFSKKEGFVSKQIRELIEKRIELKKQMRKAKERKMLDIRQSALKTITNACYGYLAFPSSKWYCYECAESAAAFGRYFIKKIISEAEKEGFSVIYADTDSCFVKLKSGNSIKNKANKFLDKVNKSLPGIMELSLQGIYKRGIFIPKTKGVAKKRYALIDEENKMTIHGLEKVRKDWSNIAKDTQENVLKFILQYNDKDAAIKYTKSVIQKIRQKKVSLHDLAIHEQLVMPLSQYKQIGPHVRAAQKLKKQGKPIGAGMVVVYVITKGSGSISDRAEPIEYATIDMIDEDYYINNQIIPAALRVLQVFNISEKDLILT